MNLPRSGQPNVSEKVVDNVQTVFQHFMKCYENKLEANSKICSESKLEAMKTILQKTAALFVLCFFQQ